MELLLWKLTGSNRGHKKRYLTRISLFSSVPLGKSIVKTLSFKRRRYLRRFSAIWTSGQLYSWSCCLSYFAVITAMYHCQLADCMWHCQTTQNIHTSFITAYMTAPHFLPDLGVQQRHCWMLLRTTAVISNSLLLISGTPTFFLKKKYLPPHAKWIGHLSMPYIDPQL